MRVAFRIRRFRSLLEVTVSEIQDGKCCLNVVSHYTSMNGENWEMTRCGYEAAFIR